MPSFITCHSQSIKYFITCIVRERNLQCSFIVLISNDETILKMYCFLVYVEVYHTCGGLKLSYKSCFNVLL